MNGSPKLILVAVGADRVGLVQSISEFIANRGCNIEDSKMAVFAGEFALIVLISGESGNLESLSSSTDALSNQTGLNIWVKRPSSRKQQEASIPYRLVASCMDHPGVVHRLSTTLSGYGVNIESMETQTYAAPISGTPIFRMEAVLSVPANLNINMLKSRFEEFEREQNIDIELTSLRK